MSLLLLLARDYFESPAQEFITIPEHYLDFSVADTLRNAHVRFIDGFSISWALGNKAVLKAKTIDVFVDDPTTAYRPVIGESVTVATKSGVVLFKGTIVDTRESALEEPNFYTVVEVDAIDKSDELSHRHVSGTFGGDPIVITSASMTAGPTQFTTSEPHKLTVGNSVIIAGLRTWNWTDQWDSALNGTRTVASVIDAQNFTIADPNPAGPGISSGGGTVKHVMNLNAIVQSFSGVLAEHDVTISMSDVGPIIEKLVADDMPLTDLFRHLSTVTGWPHRILPEGVLQFFPAGSVVADFTMDRDAVGAGLRVQRQRTTAANSVKVKYGSSMLVTKNQQFVGDGTTRIFPLSYKPASGTSTTSPGQVYDHTALAYRHVGVWGYDTLFEWLFDSTYGEYGALRQAELYAGTEVTTPLPRGAVVEFIFPVQFPQIVTVSNIPAGETPREATMTAPNVFDIDAARQAGLGKLAEVQDSPRKATVPTTAGLVWPGAVFNVDLPHRQMTGQWLVSEVSMTERGDGKLQYRYTLVEGTQAQANWRDRVREMFGGGSGGGTFGGTITGGGTAPTPGNPPGSSGLSGSGTADRFTMWTGERTLANGPAFINAEGAVEFEAALIAQGNITATGDLIATGVVRTPVLTASANLAMSPVGDIYVDPGGNVMRPANNYDVHLGALAYKYLTLHAAELWVETLVAHETMATIGGRILVAPTTTLVRDLAPADATIFTKHNNLANGDTVYMESGGRVEFMRVTSAAAVQTDGYSYTVTRNLDGTGANQWYAGDAMVNTGQVGNGFIDLYSVRGVRAGTEYGPTIVGNVRTGSGFADWAPRWAIGNLRGIYGYSSSANVFGTAFGNPAAAWISIDPTNGVRIMHGSSVFAQITASGAASFTGSVTVTGGNAATIDQVTPTAIRTATGWGHPSNTTLINGGSVYTGTITADAIAANAVTVWHLNFAVATPSNIVATINASAEGIRISGQRIVIDGNVQFGVGYNPASKIDLGGAATDINNNVTTISGGRITTGSIAADKISVGSLSALSAVLGTVSAGYITGTTMVAGKVTISASGIDIDASGDESSHNIEWSNGSVIMSRDSVSSLHLRGPGGANWSQINLYPGYASFWGGTPSGGSPTLELDYNDVWMNKLWGRTDNPANGIVVMVRANGTLFRVDSSISQSIQVQTPDGYRSMHFNNGVLRDFTT